MGTIRTLTIGAAFIAGLAANFSPAVTRSDCNVICFPAAEARAPLNILEPPKQAASATKKKITGRSKKPAQSTATKQRVKAASKKAAKQTARTVVRRTSPRSAFAKTDRGVMRGPDTIALIAMLPWWRSDPLQPIQYGSEIANSKMMAATDAWLVQHGSSLGEMTGNGSLIAHAEAASIDVAIADPDTINEIDLAAGPASPPERSFIQSLIAVLGGALAAASAARFLFV